LEHDADVLAELAQVGAGMMISPFSTLSDTPFSTVWVP
jgi:hypothetical protein